MCLLKSGYFDAVEEQQQPSNNNVIRKVKKENFLWMKKLSHIFY